jgi:putative Ca2+/H+ antiporter (TMEM165/GDT1 family)
MSDLSMAQVLGGLTAATTPFVLVFLAELGDKSQLVCMVLAARHRHWPVLAGSAAAFVVLNSLAVVFGAGLSHWIPERIVAAAVAALFAVFGILALMAEDGEEGQGEVRERSGHGIFITTFLLILLAEMGDKTQIAVAGMASTLPAVAVWIGATLALLTTSVLGVVAGRKLLRCIPLRRLRQISGVLFLLLAALALTRVF